MVFMQWCDVALVYHTWVNSVLETDVQELFTFGRCFLVHGEMFIRHKGLTREWFS